MGRDPREQQRATRPQPSVRPAIPARPKRTPYKVVVALFPEEWATLRREAEARGIEGGEVISGILTKWCHSAPPVEAPPPPEYGGDDGDDQEAVAEVG